MEQFRELGILEPILESIRQERFVEPSEIQKKALPAILKGQDVIASSATGSGKTLAFATRLIQNSEKGRGIQGLILTPTRELAEQVYLVLKKYSRYKDLNVVSVYGGVSIRSQIHGLETADIVIGTPGRLLDHLDRNTIKLDKIKMVVLDEADRMLDMGFVNEVSNIINSCPKKRQTLLFGATISQDVIHLARRYMNNPIEVSAETYVDPKKLKQVYYDIDEKLKFSLLVQLLRNEKQSLTMIFCNTRATTDFIAKNLKFSGMNAMGIHGGLSQEKRNRIIKEFHLKKTEILVCTDVAARGLDIKGVTHIYNYNIPKEAKDYIHRIGRTARAGKDGKIINLLIGKDYENFGKIFRYEEVEIEKEETPYIERTRIRWMPKSRFGSSNFQRRNQNKRFDNRSKRRYSDNRNSRDWRKRNNSNNGSSSNRNSRTWGRSNNRDSRRSRNY